jgi:AcrR family transcriptional regulator
MRKRADDVADTRQRIVEAAAHLHGTIGPAATTISAIADEAGVTRLTVYRHFPDASAIFSACSQHWAAGQLLPDRAAWGQIADPAQRVQAGLTDLYRFYRAASPMLTNVHRDADVLPAALHDQNTAEDARRRDTLLRAFTVSGAHRRRLRGALGHATSFPTWRSLCIEQGLSDRDAVSMMTALVLAVAESPQAR